MATSPRAGIINLDFKDVYQMAKDINENDPLRQAIRVGGQLISDRERDILYRRAQAEQLGLEAPDETTAVEAVGKGVDWIGDKLGEGVRAVKRKLLAPDMSGYIPAHATDAYKAQEKMVGYNPISEEAKAMEGYKPTNMEGYNPLQMIREPSSLKSPSVTYEEVEPVEMTPEAPQEDVSPVAGVEAKPTTLKAPRARSEAENWSEMYRLNPQRAAFDYARVKDAQTKKSQVYTPEQKSLIDAKQQNRIRMGEIQATVNSLDNETLRKPWIEQLNALQARDIELNNQLADYGTLGYTRITGAQPQGVDTDTGNKIVISPSTNADKYLEFAALYSADKYKNASDVPAATTIMANASKMNYDISEEQAKALHDEVVDTVSKRTGEVLKNEERSRQKAEEDRKNKAELDKRIDTKYPDLRTAIQTANALLRIIPEGDNGVGSARNDAVKKLSRMASDEALTGADFAQALGRDGFLTTLLAWANASVNVTDKEWETIKNRMNNAIESVRSRRSSAVSDFSGAEKALERINSMGSASGGSGTGKGTNKYGL